jgi:hypothetical protein
MAEPHEQGDAATVALRQLRYDKRGAFCQEVREGPDTWRFELTPMAGRSTSVSGHATANCTQRWMRRSLKE